jgi:hypothetical protein
VYGVHDRISVKVVQLKKLFSDGYAFKLPYFQRAYAWQTAAVGRLLSDVTDSMREDAGRKGYFLGKLMVAQKDGSPDAALVDGHQRIMSLTILFAVLRDLESDPKRQELLAGLIRGTGLRLTPQESMAASCERFIQAPGATAIDPDDEIDRFSETERNIIENRDYLRAELSSSEYGPSVRRALVEFLVEKCCVVVASVEDVEEAWSLLKIEEETRVDFSKADRAKFSLFAIVPAEERVACQQAWSAAEAMAGPTDMYGLLGHLRTLKRRKHTGKPVEIDIAELYTFNKPGAGLEFLSKHLLPAAERLAHVRRGGTPAIKVYVERMSWVDDQCWVPAALLWFQKPRKAAQTENFFRRLDRLVWIMKIVGFDATKQHNRIIALLREIDRSDDGASLPALDISGPLRDSARESLRSPRFDSKPCCGKVLRRLSVAMGQDPGPIERNTLTLEHVLPKSYSPKSAWRDLYPTAVLARSYTHRLGNLALLPPGENQSADTLDWQKKRPILARSGLVFTRQMADAPSWTPARILERSEDLIALLFKEWDLKP